MIATVTVMAPTTSSATVSTGHREGIDVPVIENESKLVFEAAGVLRPTAAAPSVARRRVRLD